MKRRDKRKPAADSLAGRLLKKRPEIKSVRDKLEEAKEARGGDRTENDAHTDLSSTVFSFSGEAEKKSKRKERRSRNCTCRGIRK